MDTYSHDQNDLEIFKISMKMFSANCGYRLYTPSTAVISCLRLGEKHVVCFWESADKNSMATRLESLQDKIAKSSVGWSE